MTGALTLAHPVAQRVVPSPGPRQTPAGRGAYAHRSVFGRNQIGHDALFLHGTRVVQERLIGVLMQFFISGQSIAIGAVQADRLGRAQPLSLVRPS